MMEYYVHYWNINSQKLTLYNIFTHRGFATDVLDLVNDENIDTKEQFQTRLADIIRYWFWSKCEWEIITASWPPSEYRNMTVFGNCFEVSDLWTNTKAQIKLSTEELDSLENSGITSGDYCIQKKSNTKYSKLDVSEQILPNIDLLTDYILGKVGKSFER